MKINFEEQKYNAVDPIALDLMRRMLSGNPQIRIKALQALDHPYFSNFWAA